LSPLDAYEDEMEPGFDELDSFLRETREVYVRPPRDAVASAHVAALLEAVHAAEGLDPVPQAVEAPRRIPMPKRSLKRVARALALATALVALTAGIAVAVDLPVLPDQAADEADEALVNAAARAEGRGDVGASSVPEFVADIQALLETTPASERDCEFGQGVAATASGGASGDSEGCAEAGEGEGAGAQGSQATGDQASKGVATEARSGEQSGGQETGDQASGGVAEEGGDVEGGPETGDQASGGVSGDFTDELPVPLP
jgi:hypothetical protein